MSTDLRPLPSDLCGLILPEGIRYDAIQPDETGVIGDQHQFTDIDPKSRAYTGTFYLPVTPPLTTLALARKTAEFRRSFAAPTHPLPPVFPGKSRHFVPDGEYRP